LDPTVERDPLPNESMHIDLCDIAMARLQTGDANGNMVEGVIPMKYKRVPCPVVGNIYVWLHSGAGAYWFALSVVNVKGLGAVTIVEAQTAAGDWVALKRDPNYSSQRPQERYGTWVIPQGAGPFAVPIALRFTNGAGTTITATGAIKAMAPTDSSLSELYYIDTGVQF
jgi:expansin (peptidoglycan-binding protein)